MKDDLLRGVFKFAKTIIFVIKDAGDEDAFSDFRIAINDDHNSRIRYSQF